MRKKTHKYYFSVEGETEKWYLDRLRDLINEEPTATHNVSIESKVQPNPLKYAKTVTALSKINITHLFDYESNEAVHIKRFTDTLDQMRKVKGLGKQITYQLGYSNLTFELWMVLHKMNCSYLTHRDHYLTPINNAFNEQFTELSTYKQESNFKRVLRKISLDDVREAINQAKRIMDSHLQNQTKLSDHYGFKYYSTNPSLTIHESIEKILKDCGLI